MLLAFSSAPIAKRQRGIVGNELDKNDEVSDHDSDDDVIDEKIELLFENNETNNRNQDWMIIFKIKDILLRIIELNESRDIFNNIFNTSKIFNNQKTKKKITDHTFIFRVRKNPSEFRPKEFFKPGESNVQCTLQAKNYLMLRFKYAINDSEKRSIIKEELTTQYVKKGIKWSADGVTLRAAKIAQLKQMIERWIKVNNENNNVVLLNAQSNPKGCRIGGAGAKSTIPDDLKLSIRKEIDCSILKGDKISNIQIANIIKLFCDQSDFDRPVEVYLHELNAPKDDEKETYYLTLQVINKFKREWKIRKNSGNKTYVDLEDLLVSMIPVLVKEKIVIMSDENVELSTE